MCLTCGAIAHLPCMCKNRPSHKVRLRHSVSHPSHTSPFCFRGLCLPRFLSSPLLSPYRKPSHCRPCPDLDQSAACSSQPHRSSCIRQHSRIAFRCLPPACQPSLAHIPPNQSVSESSHLTSWRRCISWGCLRRSASHLQLTVLSQNNPPAASTKDARF